MLIVKYPSENTFSGTVFGSGKGTVEENIECVIRLHQTGQYVLYLAYKGDSQEINFEFDLKHSTLDQWYTLLNSSDYTKKIITLTLNGDDSETQYFRIPFVSSQSDLYIPPAENYLRIRIYGDSLEGDMSLNLLTATRPVDPPYTVTSTIQIISGNLTIVLGDGGVWSIYGGETHVSGYTKTGVALGNQKILVKWDDDSEEYFDFIVNSGENLVTITKT